MFGKIHKYLTTIKEKRPLFFLLEGEISANYKVFQKVLMMATFFSGKVV